MDKTLADMETAARQIEVVEDRATTLANAGREDAAMVATVECVARELEQGARGHARTVEQTVIAMSTLSRSLGRLELKLGLLRPAPALAPLPASSHLALPGGVTRPSGPRPYLRRVK